MHRYATLIVVVAALWLTASAHADPPPVSEMTAIAASLSGYAEVELREPLTPFPKHGEDADFWLDGSGWLRAAELRAVDIGPDGYRPSVFILRLEGRDVTGDYALLMAGTRYRGEVLPPGRYRFYLWTEPGWEANAYLRFPGMAGETRLSPDVAVSLDQRAVPTKDGGAPLTTAFGRTGDLTSAGWAFLRLRTFSDSPSVDWIETCTYYGGDEGAGERAYERGCPGGLGGGSHSVPRRGEDMLILGFFDKPLRVGIGGNVSAFGLPPSFQVWSAYFSYGDPEFAGPAPGAATQAPAVITPSSGSFPTAESGTVPRRGSLRLVGTRLVVRARRALARVACSRAGPCSGTLRLISGNSPRRIGARAGEKRVVRLRVPRPTLRRLARRRRTRTTLVVRNDTSGGVREERLRVLLAK